MEINGPPPITLTPRQVQASLSAWQVGQVLQARVIEQPSPQAALLQVGNQQLMAETNVTLRAGQRLELTVMQLGDKPILQARLLGGTTPPASPQGGTTSGANVLQQGSAGTDRTTGATTQLTGAALLKQALPKQAGITNLLANIALLNNHPGRTAPLPPPVAALVKQLYRQLPGADKIGTGQQLKQGVTDSGVFLENKLAKAAVAMKPPQQQTTAPPSTKPGVPASANSGTDLKATLLRLLGTIQQTTRISAPKTAPSGPGGTPQTSQLPPLPFTPPPLRGQPPQAQARADATAQQLGTLPLLLLELGRQTEAALARTQLHQAASLPGGEQSGNSWALELPLRNGQQIDIFDMVISDEQQEQQDDDAAHPWSVTLAFDLDGLGPVYVRLRLIKDKVSTLFWAERAATTALFNKHLNELSQRYRDAGLESGELRCFQGPPPETDGRNTPHIVLDVKA